MFKLDLAVWEITLQCNLKCIHCMADAYNVGSTNNDLTTHEGLKLLNDLAFLGCKKVVLSGGEPFLRKEWDLFARRIIDLNMELIIISNGTIFNEEIANKLYFLGTSSLGFSLDGATAETHDYVRGVKGSFDKVINTFKLCNQKELYNSAVTTVHKYNFKELDNILTLLIDNGIKNWLVQVAKPIGRMAEAYTLSEEEYYELAEKIVNYRKKYTSIISISEADCIGYYSKLSPYLHYNIWGGCSCGINLISIENDGNVKGCPSMNNSEGNIKDTSIIDIWNDPNKFAYNRHFTSELLTGYCKECTYGNICRGGCAQNIRNKTGSPYCLYKIEKMGFDDNINLAT